MYARVETITPEIARAYLKRNTENRHIRKVSVRNYATDMRNGNWQLTPQGISFYEDGTLADGQHRLLAVLQANVPIEMQVTYDVPNTSKILDMGMKRSADDVLRFSGIDATKEVVALVRFLFRVATHNNPPIATTQDFVVEHFDMLKTAIYVTTHGTASKYNITRKTSFAAAAFCALHCGVDVKVIDRMFVCVNSGEYNLELGEGASNVLATWIRRFYTGAGQSNREKAFLQGCCAIKDFSNHINRKFQYSETKDIPYWNKTRDELLKPYIEQK